MELLNPFLLLYLIMELEPDLLNFNLRPGRIVRDLKLKNPIFQETASYGHFGRDIFTWEQPKTLKF